MQGWSGNETITVGTDEEADITLPYVRPRNLLAKLNPFSYLWNAFSSMRFSVSLVPKRNGMSDAFNVTFGQNVAKLPVMPSNPDDMVLMTATGESVCHANTTRFSCKDLKIYELLPLYKHLFSALVCSGRV